MRMIVPWSGMTRGEGLSSIFADPDSTGNFLGVSTVDTDTATEKDPFISLCRSREEGGKSRRENADSHRSCQSCHVNSL